MADGANIIHDIVDVAAENYTNYGKKPNIKIVKQENIFFMKPGQIGIMVANGGRGESGLATNAQTIYKIYNVIMTITEVSVSERDNLFADVILLFKNNPISSYDIEYDEEYPNVSRMIVDITVLGV